MSVGTDSKISFKFNLKFNFVAIPVQAGLSHGCQLKNTEPASASGSYPEKKK